MCRPNSFAALSRRISAYFFTRISVGMRRQAVPLITSRIFCASAVRLKGFCRNATPPSSTPWRNTVSSVYPEMNRTLKSGRSERHLCCEFRSAQVRHHHVRNQHVDWTRVRRRDFERLHSVRGFEHAISRPPEVVPHQFADALLVFDKQNRFGAARACASAPSVGRGLSISAVTCGR